MDQTTEKLQRLDAIEASENLCASVGAAIKRQREIAGLTMRELSKKSGVSAAMISRIESGQVSPSLATLEAISNALSLSVVTFFAETVKVEDVMFVKAGGGIPVKRSSAHNSHQYRILGTHRKNPLSFEASSVTVAKGVDGSYPNYINRGFAFVTVTQGTCVYLCGRDQHHMERGDSLSFNAELVHGLKEVITESVTLNMVSSKLI